jgi:hypothetical protein
VADCGIHVDSVGVKDRKHRRPYRTPGPGSSCLRSRFYCETRRLCEKIGEALHRIGISSIGLVDLDIDICSPRIFTEFHEKHFTARARGWLTVSYCNARSTEAISERPPLSRVREECFVAQKAPQLCHCFAALPLSVGQCAWRSKHSFT